MCINLSLQVYLQLLHLHPDFTTKRQRLLPLCRLRFDYDYRAPSADSYFLCLLQIEENTDIVNADVCHCLKIVHKHPDRFYEYSGADMKAHYP